MDSDYDIFVSYSSDVDEHIFEEIVTYFERHDKKVYHFPRDNTRYGEPIPPVLEEQIKACRLILVMVTPRTLEFECVRWEVDCANRHNKYTIAVCPYDFSDNDLPTGLRDKLAIKDKTREKLRASLKSILENLGYTAYIPAGGFGGGMIEFCAEVPKALCHIGDRPMLFHVIDSLDASPFRKVVVINHRDHAPDFISYVTSLEYPRGRVSSRDTGIARGFTGEVKCVPTERKFWPRALRDEAPKDTFLVNMCDVILSFDRDAHTKDVSVMKEDWKEAVNKHKQRKEAWGSAFLGTLITCDYYRLAAGVVQTTGGVRRNNPRGREPCGPSVTDDEHGSDDTGTRYPEVHRGG